MSSKQPKTVQLPSKEMIITRYKSAQQKRQLRNKDRSMKSITQLLKSPSSKSVQRKKTRLSPKSPKKSTEKTAEVCSSPIARKIQVESNEYRPNMLKRNTKPKKIWLKPKYEMKMVARANKRKLCTPQKEMNSPPLEINICCDSEDYSPVYSELSMSEIVRLVEDTGQLDDDDLMEILTCPSPVWWEEPPEPWYNEKPILRSSSPVEPHNNKLKERNVITNINNNITNLKNSKTDPKFNRKQLKLEKLLDSIKNKANTTDVHEQNDLEVNDLGHNKLTAGEIINNKADNDKTVSPQRSTEKRVSESTEEYFSDISFHEEMLKNLEEIEIPMESPECDDIEEDAVTNDNIENGPEKHPLDTVNDVENHLKTTVIDKQRPNFQIESPGKVPRELPPLTKCPLNNVKGVFVSPTSVRSSDDTSSVDHEMDTISDTNIKYLTDDDEQTNTDDVADCKMNNKSTKNDEKEVIDDTSKLILDKIKQFFMKSSKSKKKFESNTSDNKVDNPKDLDKKKYITVYKIISDDCDAKSTVTDDTATKYINIDNKKDEKPKDVEKNKHQLNSFYKKCKSIHRRKNDADTEAFIRKDKNFMVTNKLSDADSCVSKTIVPNGSVKYCFKCSSIFETAFCTYCSRKSSTDVSKKQCSHDALENRAFDAMSCNLCEN
ncbi:uncharacterized protein ACR2FA_010853 [Aphomia sociella]